jgi:hypothetical protein
MRFYSPITVYAGYFSLFYGILGAYADLVGELGTGEWIIHKQTLKIAVCCRKMSKTAGFIQETVDY